MQTHKCSGNPDLDTELMQAAYDKLGSVFGLRYPEEPEKLRAWKEAQALVERAREALAEPFKKKAEPKPLPSLDEPCPHPARNGRHEIYVMDTREPKGEFCRACGARRDDGKTRQET
jgi:hypothetical protein